MGVNAEAADRRSKKRINTFWLAFNKEEKTVLGYITEISEIGMKIWINKNDLKNNPFSIYLSPPKQVSPDSVDFDLIKVWNEEKVNRNFIEIGCKFKELSEEQENIVYKLIDFFKEESEQFSIEIDEYVNSMKDIIENLEGDIKNNKN